MADYAYSLDSSRLLLTLPLSFWILSSKFCCYTVRNWVDCWLPILLPFWPIKLFCRAILSSRTFSSSFCRILTAPLLLFSRSLRSNFGGIASTSCLSFRWSAFMRSNESYTSLIVDARDYESSFIWSLTTVIWLTRSSCCFWAFYIERKLAEVFSVLSSSLFRIPSKSALACVKESSTVYCYNSSSSLNSMFFAF